MNFDLVGILDQQEMDAVGVPADRRQPYDQSAGEWRPQKCGGRTTPSATNGVPNGPDKPGNRERWKQKNGDNEYAEYRLIEFPQDKA